MATEPAGFDKGIDTNEPSKHIIIESSKASAAANSGRHGSSKRA